MENQLFEAVKQIEDRNKSRVFMFAIMDPIHREFVDIVNDNFLHNKINIPKLDIILYSIGGQIDAAFQLVKVFRENCLSMRLIILRYAKSAATLIALGADEILMRTCSELGPLDAQIEHPRDPERRISALDGFNTLKYLRNFSLETTDLFTLFFVRERSLRIDKALNSAIYLSNNLIKPLFEQIDPLNLGEYERTLRIAQEYGKKLLSKYSKLPENKANNIVEKLVKDYPSHTFVIDYEEAKRLGLNVKKINREEEKKLCEIYRIFKGLNLKEKTQLIGFVTDKGKEGNKKREFIIKRKGKQ